MFNLKQAKESVAPYEKYHRENTVGPKANDADPIWEKQLPHRDGYEQTVTEDQISSEWKTSDTPKDDQILEKLFEDAKGYVTHRSDAANISVPPINVLVEKLRQNRASEYKTDKSPHWSQTYDEKKQQGALPSWPGQSAQHDKISLNNDPRRFEGTNNMPVHYNQPENDSARAKTTTIKPLIGSITTADIDSVVNGIKSGQAVDFDTAMTAIIKQADDEKRELTPIERKAVVDLKIARTKSLIKYARNH